MIVIVDMNVLFSAIISPNGRIAKLLTDSILPIERISCYYSFVELFKHQPKIVKYAKKPVNEVIDDLYTVLSSIQIYNESLIDGHHWQEAARLTEGVDSFDVNYVALALYTGGWLWTGDKPLTEHLRTMGFNQVVNTHELSQMLNIE